MKKRILFSFIALCSAVFGAMAQRNYTFNAAALNVDGLPNSILGISINPDGKEAAGATELCGILANSGWDIVGFSEDFNFHDYLVAAPASNYYNFGAHGGKVSGTSNSTDGLGFACNKRFTMSGGDKTEWNTLYGGSGLTSVGDNGADGMIDKGFRMYTVTLATGVSVDVYVLHMDANTADSDDDYDSNGRDKNIVAREAQLQQLADAVMKNMGTNKRPVIILGDTNCRYTREAVETGFINYINADARFTIKDAWVEHMWGGTYPTYGTGSIMTDAYGMQKGEVVDKVFYINTTESNLTLKSNSYLHDASVTVSDHKPVVVNFTLTDPNGTPLTDDWKENNWTLDISDGGEPAPTFMGVQPEDGKAYFLKNVSTGLYLKWGADYGSRGILGSAGVAFTFKQSGANWILKTSDNTSLLGDPNTWLDNGGENVWTLEVVPGTEYQYYIRNSHGTLSPLDNDAFNRVNAVAHNANDDRQKWVLLTPEKVKTEMLQGNGTFPYDVTPLFRAADFDRFDGEYGIYSYWTGADASTIGGIWWEGAEGYNGCAAIVNTTKSTSLSQTISGMPAGTYKISFSAFYRNRKKSLFSTSDQTMDATITVGGLTFKAKQNTGTDISTDRYNPGVVFRDDNSGVYAQMGTFTLSTAGDITFKITNPSTTGNNWVCLDNIKLLYSATGFSDPYLEYKKAVINKVNETYEEVIKLNEAGQAAYDITVVVERVKNNQVTSTAEANALCNVVDASYANALAAHNAYNIKQVIDNMNANGGDITGAIINPSFETGDLTGWTVGEAWDLGVKETSNGTYAAEGSDGSYLFNAYSGEHGHTTSVIQTIKGVPNGLYELKAMLTSHGATEAVDANNPKTQANRVYLVGNGYHASIAAERNNKFEEATLYFLVEDGTAVIGAIGGNKGGGADFIHYWPWEGCYFKADNFRLKYICDVSHGRLKLALDEAASTSLDSYGQAALNISNYQAVYDNKSLFGDGKAEVEAIHSALQTAAKAQRTAGADMTWAIANPSFETGDYTGWSTTVGWDTGVKPQENGTYTTAGTDGRYLFNTWNNDANATNSGVNAAITQTVTGIPNGTYRLSAMVASDNGNSLMLTGNGVTTTISASTNGAGSGVFPSVECVVTDGKLSIEVKGANDCWYKCDDFHLTLVAPIAVENVTLDKESATLIEGETLSLTAVASPDHATDKAITWSTSDDKVATVDENGLITAVAPGTATITATSGDKSASCVVTVETASYLFTLKVEDQVYFTQTVKRGTNLVTLMEEHEVVIPTKVGYTFSEWELPETMPANDLTLNGTFTINKYTVTFQIGEEIISSEELEYGAAIVAPGAPEKEGHTFDGWGEIAETVPAEDVTYQGTYIVNIYKVYYCVGEELVYTDEVAYGEAIPEYIYEPTTEGDVFVGWVGETYETMPAHDITYTAEIKHVVTNIKGMIDNGRQVIYDLSGHRVINTQNLKGIYIVNGKKVFFR